MKKEYHHTLGTRLFLVNRFPTDNYTITYFLLFGSRNPKIKF